MTPHSVRRLVAAVAALSLGLSGPLPAYALRAGLEGTSQTEVARTLGAPATASARAAAGTEETIGQYAQSLLELNHAGIINAMRRVLAEWDDAVTQKVAQFELESEPAGSPEDYNWKKAIQLAKTMRNDMVRDVGSFDEGKLKIRRSGGSPEAEMLFDMLHYSVSTPFLRHQLLAVWAARHPHVSRDEFWKYSNIVMPSFGDSDSAGPAGRHGAGMEEGRIEVTVAQDVAFPMAVVQPMTPAEFRQRFPEFSALRAGNQGLLDGARRIQVVQVVGDRVTVYRTQTLAGGLEEALQHDPAAAWLQERLVFRGIPVSPEPLIAPGVVVVHDPIFAPRESRLPVVEASAETLPTAMQLYLVGKAGNRQLAELPAAQVVTFTVLRGGLEERYVAAFL